MRSQWIGELSSKLLLSDLRVDGWAVRLTEPQARAAFLSSARAPREGLTPEELPACIARCGFEKYMRVEPMGAGAKVAAFLENLLKGVDEDEARA